MEPNWLDEDETEAWRAVVALMLRLPATLDAQLQRCNGLTLFEYLVLSFLSMAPDTRLRMSELSQLTNGTLSRLSNVMRRLEARGWVERSTDPADGRYTVATLTESGMQLVVEAAPGHVEAVRHFVIDPLTKPQLRSVAVAGQRIQERLGDPTRGPSTLG